MAKETERGVAARRLLLLLQLMGVDRGQISRGSGVSRATLQLWANGTVTPSERVLARLTRYVTQTAHAWANAVASLQAADPSLGDAEFWGAWRVHHAIRDPMMVLGRAIRAQIMSDAEAALAHAELRDAETVTGQRIPGDSEGPRWAATE
jgi:transcriptional regulator with XRE-family HTH domain